MKAETFFSDNTQANHLPWRVHAAVWGTFIVLTFILVWVFLAYRDTKVWNGWKESKDLRNPSYTEAIHENSVFRTRANTWSNLAYVLVGLYAIATAVVDQRRAWPKGFAYIVRTPALTGLFGLACCYLGFGSGFFHASLTRFGQQLDVASMYSPVLALIAIGLGTLYPRIQAGRSRPTWPLLAGSVILIDALLYAYKWSMASEFVLPTLIQTLFVVGVLVSIRRLKWISIRLLSSSFAFLLAGVFFRQMDVAGWFTGPDSWLQGHVLWHIFTAIALSLGYAFFRSAESGKGEAYRVLMEDKA
ncbi:MAG: ceramidase domain-containing protein [Rectinemataceae bacterium]